MHLTPLSTGSLIAPFLESAPRGLTGTGSAGRSTGLAPPEIVRAATDDYVENPSLCVTALVERPFHALSIDPKSWSPDLFNSWKRYAKETGETIETIGTEKAFSQGLVERGFERKRSHGKRRFFGIKPKLDYEIDGNE